MVFEPCKMEPDFWLRPRREDYYEHIAIYTDNPLIASKDPKSTTDVLTTKHSFKLKVTGPLSYHLACDFGRDDDGTLYFVPKKCI